MAFKMKGSELYGKMKLNRNMDDTSKPDGRAKSSAFQKKEGIFSRLHKKLYNPEQNYAGSSKSPADAKRERENDPRYKLQQKRDRERYDKGETLSNPSNKAKFAKQDQAKKDRKTIDDYAKKHLGVGKKESKPKKMMATKKEAKRPAKFGKITKKTGKLKIATKGSLRPKSGESMKDKLANLKKK